MNQDVSRNQSRYSFEVRWEIGAAAMVLTSSFGVLAFSGRLASFHGRINTASRILPGSCVIFPYLPKF